ncbi:AhpD family alkylhydroperoxidase [Spinactinospora alkalitolerans]|uniref:AhpD family alkylhydroperoxidase n=1 Tax=Spinactinospora alkalitolerans TaxID=687207 RepID=A0A852TQL3_9ACTN|nr:carboxymuconolactone decarboxylase family protein [Spinactinospora alkalitolerans]NYE45875.1 AhpD family alkylhydroperoxidase [Spinactinospora alkalitolerans]
MSANTRTRRRADVAEHLPDVYKHLVAIDALTKDVLGGALMELVKLRASYINGCAFCIDMHARDALRRGEESRRLFALAAWHEAPGLFTEAERAAFGLVDAVTRLGEHGVPDEVYDAAAEHHTERELAALIVATATINAYNRIGIARRAEVPPLR